MRRAPSQDEIARGFVVLFGHIVRFEPRSKTWHRWTGSAWDVSEFVRHAVDQQTPQDVIARKLKAICEPMRDYVFAGLRDHCRVVANRYGAPQERARMGSHGFLSAVFKLIEADPAARVSIEALAYRRAPRMSDLLIEATFQPDEESHARPY